MWRSAKLIPLLALSMLTCPAKAQVMVGYSDNAAPSKYSNTPSDQYQLPVLETVSRAKPTVQLYPQDKADSPQTYRGYIAEKSGEPLEPQSPVDFAADVVSYDDEKQIVSAKGSVALTQDGRTLKADEMSYNVKTGIASADGDVLLLDRNGDQHRADSASLRQNLSRGTITNLTSRLADGSTIKASSAYRTVDNKTVMEDASYTACVTCSFDDEKEPIWQIKAAEVTHDKTEKTVEYKNATFEAYGVPVAYFPYFAHPDGSEDRKSGLLAPDAGFKTNEGLMLDNRYYWAMAPDEDATFGFRVFGKENPLLYAQWRKRWYDAEIVFNFGGTYSDYTHTVGGIETIEKNELRGHVIADALWHLDEKWRLGADINWASDDEYMDQYDFMLDDILTSDIYAERFSGRDYATIRFLTFQDTRTLDEPVDQPEIVPEIYAGFQGNPNEIPYIGGSWYADTSYLGLRRSGDEQDMNRVSLAAGWKRRFASAQGLLTKLDISARQDAYFVRDYTGNTMSDSQSYNETRFFPQVHAVSSLPMVNDFSAYQVRLEPIAAITFAPDLNKNEGIPNEDSQDVQLDIDSLFNPSRFPGIDGVEDQSRFTYGLRSGLYSYDEGQISTFIGQSYRFDRDGNPFPAGSGLNGRSSDVVGSLSGQYLRHSFDYRFQLDSRKLNSGRHEFDVGLDWKRYGFDARYLYAKSIEGTEFDASREQISVNGFYFVADKWRLNSGIVRDFGETDGLRKAYIGLDHYDQCLSWGVTAQRNLTDDTSSDSELEILFRLGLKNIGEHKEAEWHDAKAPGC